MGICECMLCWGKKASHAIYDDLGCIGGLRGLTAEHLLAIPKVAGSNTHVPLSPSSIIWYWLMMLFGRKGNCRPGGK